MSADEKVRQISLADALNWNIERICEHVGSLKKLIGDIESASGPALALKATALQLTEFTLTWIDLLKETYDNLGRSN